MLDHALGPGFLCCTVMNSLDNERIGVCIVDHFMAGAIVVPVDLADEIGKDEIGATCIQEKKLTQFLGGESMFKFFQMDGGQPVVNQIAGCKALHDNISQPPGGNVGEASRVQGHLVKRTRVQGWLPQLKEGSGFRDEAQACAQLGRIEPFRVSHIFAA
jgi:hypothetical protein